MIPDIKEIKFKLFLPSDHQILKVNILSDINTTDLLVLLDLFILSNIYETIIKNIN